MFDFYLSNIKVEPTPEQFIFEIPIGLPPEPSIMQTFQITARPRGSVFRVRCNVDFWVRTYDSSASFQKELAQRATDYAREKLDVMLLSLETPNKDFIKFPNSKWMAVSGINLEPLQEAWVSEFKYTYSRPYEIRGTVELMADMTKELVGPCRTSSIYLNRLKHVGGTIL